jgi:hypothetical protein
MPVSRLPGITGQIGCPVYRHSAVSHTGTRYNTLLKRLQVSTLFPLSMHGGGGAARCLHLMYPTQQASTVVEGVRRRPARFSLERESCYTLSRETTL